MRTIEEIEEDRREEMQAMSHLLRILQIRIEGTDLRNWLSEVIILQEQMKKPLEMGKIKWAVRWEFNQLLRPLGLLNYGANREWVQKSLADLEWVCERTGLWQG
jgi:hypothetical protein